ncbi:MAG: PH domain-containing protein [Nitriliruptoraceae bacterium]
MSQPPPQPPEPPPPPPQALGGPARAESGPVTVRPGEEVARPGLDDRERELAPAVVISWRITAALSSLLPAVVTSVLGFVFAGRWGWLVLALVVGAFLFAVVLYPPMRFRRWRWQLSGLAVDMRSGVLVRRQETVPYFRIQQIDIVAGPVDRLLGLASLQVTTASASGSATLPGIEAESAPVVRVELLARAAQAVANHPGDLRDAV